MKKIVVIGGGFAGSDVARKLENFFHVTLIDTKDYFEFTPGVLRSIVEPEHVKKIQVLHKNYLKKTKVIIGAVEEVNKIFVKVKGKKISFDYLVISAGSTYNAPFKEQKVVVTARADHLKKYYRSLCEAKKILIIGGGPVGVELAGEIIWKYGNEKEITIVHGGKKLIERNSAKAIFYAEKFLKKNKVKIIYEERVKDTKGKNYITDKGKSIRADIAFLCTGIIPNFSLLKKNFSNSLNEKNQVKVNEFLQVEGFSNIFAAGDLTNMNEEKTAQNAQRQAEIAARNILHLEKKENLERYISKRTPMVISLGKYKGVFDAKNYTLTGIIPAFMKWAVERWEMWKK